MAAILKIGQTLKGAVNSYNITKQIHSSVFIALDSLGQKVIVKSIIGHWRLENEAEVLRLFQAQTSALRPLIDQVKDVETPSIILKYLDSDLRVESAAKTLSRPEIKRVAKTVIGALQVLHQGGYVHTDIKLDNILVNHGNGETRFSDIQLADLGGTVPEDSKWAKGGHTVGAPIWRSPELLLNLPWGTPTDIWSFGTMIISLIYGDDWHMFDPSNEGVNFDDPEFEFSILKRHHKFLGPFPSTYSEFATPDTVALIIRAMQSVPGAQRKPFHLITQREMHKDDNVFLQKIMKLDPRDRP